MKKLDISKYYNINDELGKWIGTVKFTSLKRDNEDIKKNYKLISMSKVLNEDNELYMSQLKSSEDDINDFFHNPKDGFSTVLNLCRENSLFDPKKTEEIDEYNKYTNYLSFLSNCPILFNELSKTNDLNSKCDTFDKLIIEIGNYFYSISYKYKDQAKYDFLKLIKKISLDRKNKNHVNLIQNYVLADSLTIYAISLDINFEYREERSSYKTTESYLASYCFKQSSMKFNFSAWSENIAGQLFEFKSINFEDWLNGMNTF